MYKVMGAPEIAKRTAWYSLPVRLYSLVKNTEVSRFCFAFFLAFFCLFVFILFFVFLSFVLFLHHIQRKLIIMEAHNQEQSNLIPS